MEFNFNIPVQVFYGNNSIENNKNLFKQFGNKAVIVTGKTSGIKSGALKDVTKLLESINIDYCIYDEIINNPTLENVENGAIFAKKEKATFVIAIGGGSPIDGAKAIAALCTNNINPIDLINTSIKTPSLPIIAIATTAGTGSEVTPYSILTVNKFNTKKNFYSKYSFPKIAFVVPKYTYSLSDKVTIDTAFDAFSHLLESYLSKKSTANSDIFAIEGIKAFSKCINSINNRNFTERVRDNLMYASYLGGIAISHTGTTIVHAMGYSLTYFKNITHGHANSLLIGEYLRYNYDVVNEKIYNVLRILDFSNIAHLEKYLLTNVEAKPNISETEIEKFSALAYEQGSVKNNPKLVTKENIKEIYIKVFKGE